MRLQLKIFFFLLICLFTLAACSSSTNPSLPEHSLPKERSPAPRTEAEKELEVHFLDVGQGDAIFVRFPGGETLLIDGGDRERGPQVVEYLKNQGVKALDFLVATHPHADHIGGLNTVLEALPVKRAYLPKVTHTSATFQRLLGNFERHQVKVSQAKAGLTLELTRGAQAVFLGPLREDYQNLNNHSAVLHLSFKEISFLLTGDAEVEAEAHMLKNPGKLRAHVLKVGHHGSSTSTTREFLEKVRPSYAVISAAQENDYGHPHQETLRILAEKGVKTFWTAQSGHIVMKTNGQELVVPSSPLDLQKLSSALDKVWIDQQGKGLIKGNIGSNGKIYHLPGGQYYEQVKPEVWFQTEREALKAGFRKSAR